MESDGETLNVSFFTIYNSFLGMYQILSSENWTSIMYSVTRYQVDFHSSWIGASFCILWFIFANCKCPPSPGCYCISLPCLVIVLNMFIAVIQENFDVSEDEKRLQQVKAFLQKKEQGFSSSYGLASCSNCFISQLTRLETCHCRLSSSSARLAERTHWIMDRQQLKCLSKMP